MEKYKLTFTLAILVILSGCNICPPLDAHYEAIKAVDDPLISLSRAVDVVIDALPVDAQDEVIFNAVRARSGDSHLFVPFAGYKLRAKIKNEIGLILVCTQDGKYGIIEDASCTSRIETWRPVGSPCDYMLDAAKVCQ
jgi:hypothetical protein